MSSQPRTKAGCKALAALVALGAILGGCSDIYYDRRETVALGAEDHIDSNRAAQMVDPWPRYVANKNIAFNGERMQAAVERYRRNKVKEPCSYTTTSNLGQVSCATEAGPTTQNVQSAPAAPVK